ncbi:MAG: 4Fe-4S binding protein [Candidatus Thermoplasmatota archaeon]|nr:4Fe-4S binding protein [Candidatus Thermoplasmatota archaeon]MCL5955745.1 4Fe-4S binding protein [Candidatus Thermoplasmatota archaeon]
MQNLPIVIAVIVIMTTFIAYSLNYLKQNSENFTLRKMAYMVILLTMMGSMLNALNYFAAAPPGFFTTILTVNLAMFIMTISIVYLLWISTHTQIQRMTRKMALAFSLLFAWNEVSMGAFLFTVAYTQNTRISLAGTANIMGYFTSGINSFLFVIPMISEMLFILYFFKESRIEKIMFSSIIAMAAATPSMLHGIFYTKWLSLAFTAFMLAFMIILFEWIANRRNTITETEMSRISALFIIYSIMSLGVFLGAVSSEPYYLSWAVYGVGMLLGMFFYFYIALDPVVSGKRVGWLKHPSFMFKVLLLSFLSELFMSGALLYLFSSAHPSDVSGFADFSAMLGGVNNFSLPAVAVDVPYIIGAIANSYVFLTIMGIEMGALVVFRMRKLQWKEKRVNLSLALAAFALYTIFWPNFGPESFYRILPLWANSGALGPVYPVVIVALVGSYALYAVLALLFGRRSYCSTLCPSAVMYGGTLGQQMIGYNYQSDFSRKNIGSKFRAAIYPYISMSWVFMIVFSYLSFETSSGMGKFTIYGIDPAVFFSFFIWNFLWYVFFISIPFVGMSPCRRYGWCTTGTFVGFFSKIGLFKLKVRSPDTCVTCPTKDCVSACEVGLGDLPGQFIKQGFFKSSKCVGAGSCVVACPYDNIFFYDIRNFIKEKREKKFNQRL